MNTVRLDDSRELWFLTYSLGNRRRGSCRIYEHTPKYSGPTKNGIDMSLEELTGLGEVLAVLASEVENGAVLPPLEYARIPAGRDAEWVVQVLEGRLSSEDLILDIRKHVSSEAFTGFTRKGMRLEFERIDDIITNLPGVCESLKAYRRGEWGLFAAQDAEEAEPEAVPESVPEQYRDYF